MKIYVIGGAGFFGTHVVTALLDQYPKAKISIIDSLRSRELLMPRPYEQSEMLQKTHYERLIRGWPPGEVDDVIVHLAAVSLRKHLYAKATEAFEDNARGVLMLCDHLVWMRWPGRLVYVSSSEVYGDAPVPTNGYDEDDRMWPVTPYAVAKHAAERTVLYAARYCGLNALVVRPFNLYGPWAHFEGALGEAIPRWILAAIQRQPLKVYGHTTRDFTWAADAAHGIVAAMEHGKTGHDYNLASGKTHHMASVASLICSYCPGSTIQGFSQRLGDTPYLLGNAATAKKELGWAPEMPFEEGLLQYVDWFRAMGFNLEAMAHVAMEDPPWQK